MIYRVILKVSYYQAHFDFDNIESAGDFAKTILTHQVDTDDCKKPASISLKIINPEIKSEDDDE